MSLPSESSRIAYTANGVTTAFAFPYAFFEDDDIVVAANGATQTNPTHYTVTGAGTPAGGTVNFVVAPADTVEVVIWRRPDFTQETDYVTNDSFPAQSHEDAIDLLTQQTQYLLEQTKRSLRTSMAEGEMPILENVAMRAGKVLGFDDDGNPDYLSLGEGGVPLPDHTHPLLELEDSGATVGQVATWDGVKWAPEDPDQHTHALSSLQQSGATTGQTATWSGSAWVPATPAAGSANVQFFNKANRATTAPTSATAIGVEVDTDGEMIPVAATGTTPGAWQDTVINPAKSLAKLGSAFYAKNFNALKTAIHDAAATKANCTIYCKGQMDFTDHLHIFSTTFTAATFIGSTWTAAAHPFENGMAVLVAAEGTMPTNLNPFDTYFIFNKATNTFQLTTIAGSAAHVVGPSGGSGPYYIFRDQTLTERLNIVALPGTKFNFRRNVKEIRSTSIDNSGGQMRWNLPAHGYVTGECVVLRADGPLPMIASALGVANAGIDATNRMQHDTGYFVRVIDADYFKLCSTYANAIAGTGLPFVAVHRCDIQIFKGLDGNNESGEDTFQDFGDGTLCIHRPDHGVEDGMRVVFWRNYLTSNFPAGETGEFSLSAGNSQNFITRSSSVTITAVSLTGNLLSVAVSSVSGIVLGDWMEFQFTGTVAGFFEHPTLGEVNLSGVYHIESVSGLNLRIDIPSNITINGLGSEITGTAYRANSSGTILKGQLYAEVIDANNFRVHFRRANKQYVTFNTDLPSAFGNGIIFVAAYEAHWLARLDAPKQQIFENFRTGYECRARSLDNSLPSVFGNMGGGELALDWYMPKTYPMTTDSNFSGLGVGASGNEWYRNDSEAMQAAWGARPRINGRHDPALSIYTYAEYENGGFAIKIPPGAVRISERIRMRRIRSIKMMGDGQRQSTIICDHFRGNRDSRQRWTWSSAGAGDIAAEITHACFDVAEGTAYGNEISNLTFSGSTRIEANSAMLAITGGGGSEMSKYEQLDFIHPGRYGIHLGPMNANHMRFSEYDFSNWTHPYNCCFHVNAPGGISKLDLFGATMNSSGQVGVWACFWAETGLWITARRNHLEQFNHGYLFGGDGQEENGTMEISNSDGLHSPRHWLAIRTLGNGTALAGSKIEFFPTVVTRYRVTDITHAAGILTITTVANTGFTLGNWFTLTECNYFDDEVNNAYKILSISANVITCACDPTIGTGIETFRGWVSSHTYAATVLGNGDAVAWSALDNHYIVPHATTIYPNRRYFCSRQNFIQISSLDIYKSATALPSGQFPLEIYHPAHGFDEGDYVLISSPTYASEPSKGDLCLPTGMPYRAPYWVKRLDADRIQLYNNRKYDGTYDVNGDGSDDMVIYVDSSRITGNGLYGDYAAFYLYRMTLTIQETLREIELGTAAKSLTSHITNTRVTIVADDATVYPQFNLNLRMKNGNKRYGQLDTTRDSYGIMASDNSDFTATSGNPDLTLVAPTGMDDGHLVFLTTFETAEGSTGILPDSLLGNTPYWIINKSGSTVQLTTKQWSTAHVVTPTSNSTGICRMINRVPRVPGSVAYLEQTVAAYTAGVPNDGIFDANGNLSTFHPANLGMNYNLEVQRLNGNTTQRWYKDFYFNFP